MKRWNNNEVTPSLSKPRELSYRFNTFEDFLLIFRIRNGKIVENTFSEKISHDSSKSDHFKRIAEERNQEKIFSQKNISEAMHQPYHVTECIPHQNIKFVSPDFLKNEVKS